MENYNLEQGFGKKEESKQNIIDNINQSMTTNLIDSQKQYLKQHKLKIAEKTQRIKKEKKHIIKNQYYSKAQIQAFQDEIIFEAINRLRNRSTNSTEEGSLIHKKLTRQRLLQFLQLIQQEYSKTINIYLQSNINKELCGNLKKILLKFIDHTVQAFPVLNNIVYRYAFQYYKTGPLQYRFQKLMEKTITPILNHASQQFLNQKKQAIQKEMKKNEKSIDNTSTQISKSPERQLLEQFQEENKKKLQKKKRKKNRKLQQKLSKQQTVEERPIKQITIQLQLPKQYQQLNKLLQDLTINQERNICHIQQKYIQKWRAMLGSKNFSQMITK